MMLTYSKTDNFQIARALRGLENLEVLNIRNLPHADHFASWSATDFTHKGLATAVIEARADDERIANTVETVKATNYRYWISHPSRLSFRRRLFAVHGWR